MVIARTTVILPKRTHDEVMEQLGGRGYNNFSEYVRDLIRHDMYPEEQPGEVNPNLKPVEKPVEASEKVAVVNTPSEALEKLAELESGDEFTCPECDGSFKMVVKGKHMRVRHGVFPNMSPYKKALTGVTVDCEYCGMREIPWEWAKEHNEAYEHGEVDGA